MNKFCYFFHLKVSVICGNNVCWIEKNICFYESTFVSFLLHSYRQQSNSKQNGSFNDSILLHWILVSLWRLVSNSWILKCSVVFLNPDKVQSDSCSLTPCHSMGSKYTQVELLIQQTRNGFNKLVLLPPLSLCNSMGILNKYKSLQREAMIYNILLHFALLSLSTIFTPLPFSA